MPTHGGETKRYGLSPLLKRSLIPSWEFPPHDLIKSNYLPQVLTPNAITDFNLWIWEGHKHSVHNTRAFQSASEPKEWLSKCSVWFLLTEGFCSKAHDSDFTYSFTVALLQKEECLFNIIKYLLTKYSHTSMKVWINEGKDRWWSQLGLKININISTKIYSWS